MSRNMQDANNQRARCIQGGSGRQPNPRMYTRVSSSALRNSGRAGELNYNCGLDNPINSRCPFMQQNPTRSFDYGALRSPYHSTPIHTVNFPQHEALSQQAEFGTHMMDPIDPSVIMAARTRKALPTRYLPNNTNMATKGSSDMDTKIDTSSRTNDSRFLLNQAKTMQEGSTSPSKRVKKQESLMEWFDRTVEKELKKRREGALNIGENFINLDTPSGNPLITSPRSSHSSKLLLDEASVSGLDIQAKLRKTRDTELVEAVDKLAKAETMFANEGAVRAAERAAASVPREFAEEAAAAGAQGFQAQLTNVVRQEFNEGVKPIEVVGYVGITRPKKLKKPENMVYGEYLGTTYK